MKRSKLLKQLGFTGRDQITGFTGTITGYATYITGCDQFLLAPSIDERGGAREAHWYDIQRIEIITKKDQIKLKDVKIENDDKLESITGPDKPAPIR